MLKNLAKSWYSLPILQSSRFKVHDKMGNRKLLWHGTNVAVVAAILKSGLRIMPHSGGRVGAGIYFASENAKSAGYGNISLNCSVQPHEKTCLLGFRPCPTQTGLYGHRRWLEA